ncbi:DedA family protein [Homoserinibacter sp. YIM 151385]|uniref:DedA family protein n=1 Tax=Homoserinibacter sp. YIM 151385 TaxID=2985506 RepID=UPI0022F1134E|nr:DedA family protein [Homoserinibacter sp. YIM 151385]WBU38951.1 DedA family protein [Homoserinibacter sp. YIM 151385]
MNEALTWILDLVSSVDPVLRTLLAGIGILLETSILVGLVVPGDSIVIVASTGVEGPVEYVALVATVIVGALCGESVGFAIGRWFGPRLRHSRLGRRLGEQNWARAERYLARRGGPAVFVSRFLPVLHSLIPVTVGMSAMSYRRFIAWTAPACTIWAVLYVSVGSAAAGSYRELSGQAHWAGYLFAAIIIGFGILALVAKKVIQGREARHMEHDAHDANRAADSGVDGPTA